MTKDEAIGTIQGVYFYFGIEKIRKLLMEVVDYIKEQPEIVRCEDCKHWDDEHCNMLETIAPKDFYCQLGEKE